MEQLIHAVNKEKNERFKKSWVKLDKGSKLNRISIFIHEEKEKYDLNETQTKQLKKLLFLQCENGNLNKVNDVEYSNETYHIITIKNLEFNEQKKIYSFNIPTKQAKPVSKSKSNIDRHFSRSKENKR
tara:strand:+ start:666 stop:1049 length:384 start_codon:yes stop_codon:yes gene_type:complete